MRESEITKALVTIREECVRVVIDGDVVFDGSKAELRNVLEQHGRFMDYLNSQREGGEL